jgi:zinc protease
VLVWEERTVRESEKLPAQHFAEDLLRHFLFREQLPAHATELAWARELLPRMTIDQITDLTRVWRGDEGRVLAGRPRRSYQTRPRSAPWSRRRNYMPCRSGRTRRLRGRCWRPSPHRRASSNRAQTERPGPRCGGSPTGSASSSRRLRSRTTGSASPALRRVELRWSPIGTSFQARFAAEILQTSGAGALSELEIGRLLAGTDLSVDVGLTDDYQTVTAGARTQDLETMLQLLHLRLTQPTKNPDAFHTWKAKRTETERHRRDSPDERMNDEMLTVLFGDHPRRRPVTAEAIGRVDLERVFGIWKQRFADFNGFTFVFVGSVDPSSASAAGGDLSR